MKMKMRTSKTATELSWEADRKMRKGWGDICPTTQVIPNKKNPKIKHKEKEEENE